jgi:hypothetical protein
MRRTKVVAVYLPLVQEQCDEFRTLLREYFVCRGLVSIYLASKAYFYVVGTESVIDSAENCHT